MKQRYTFSKIFSFLPFLLAAFLWLGGSSVFAGGQFFAVNNSTSLSGSATICNGSTVDLCATFSTTSCGSGANTSTNVDVSWYYNTTGATGTLAGANQLGTTVTASTTTGASVTYCTSIDASVLTDMAALPNGTYYVFAYVDAPTNTTCGIGNNPPGSQNIYSGSGGTPAVIQLDVVDPGVSCHNYCTTSWSDPDDEYISAVTFGTINETSGTGGYIDNTGICTDASPGQTIQLCVDITTNGAALTQDLWVFFDWNNDGDFNDAGESIDIADIPDFGAGTNQYCVDVTVPAGASIGSIAMRIITAEGGDPGPCDTGAFGDAVDFCVNINNCTTTIPNAGTDQLLASCATSATLAGNTITQGTGTWSLAGGSGTITDPSNPASGVTSLGAGQNFFVWTVEDAPCPTLTDTVIIETQDTPTPANAGTDLDACNTGTFDMAANTPGAGETGTWTCAGALCGNLSPATGVSNDPNQVFTISGSPAAGTSATLTWTINNGTCTHSDNITVSIISGVSAATITSGAATECVGDPASIVATAPANGQGTWSVGAGVNIADPTSASTTATGITAGSYTITWTVSASGCTSQTDNVALTVNPCDPNVISDVCTAGGYTFTDGAGDYGNDEHIVQTYCSDDAANPYITATFSEFDLYSSLDYMTIIDGDGTGDPFIWSSTTNGAPTTITSSNPDGCLTFVFMSNQSNTDPGFTAAITCSNTAGSNTSICNDSDCQGGCGRTICGDGTYEWAGDGISMPELNTANNDCLNANEQCNVWYYINPASVPPGGGDLSLNILSNGGQDQDFAVWEGFNSTLDCPVVSQEQPIACNWVAMNTSGSGTGFSDDYPDAWHAPSLQISEQDIANGIYYMVLINTYNSGGACPQTTVDLTFGGSALLSCEPLGVTIADIRGVPHEDYNFIYWETMNEYNCESFTLERSKNKDDWEVVGVLPGAGTSDRSLYYSMKDFNRENPITYYRLKETDTEGEITYSKVISVSTLGDTESWITDLFPNPASESFTFQYNGNNQEEALNVYVFDMLGRQVVHQELMVSKHDANVVNTQQLENGQYRAVFVQGQKRSTQSFTILRK